MKQTKPSRTEQIRRHMPYVFLVLFVFLVFFLKERLPQPAVIIDLVTNLYSTYGYFIVFLAGVLEATFVVGFYLPGSAAILLGAVVARSGVVSLPVIIFLGTMGLSLGYTINYFLGKYGWYHILERFGVKEPLEVAKKKLHQHKGKTLFLGYISPNMGSFLSTAAGITHVPFREFVLRTVLAQLFWGTVWGVTAYILGDVFVELFLKYFGIVVAAGIFIWVVTQVFKK